MLATTLLADILLVMYSETLAGRNLAEKIQAFESHEQLHQLLLRVKDGTTQDEGWDPGKALEYLILRAFELEGAAVQAPFTVKSPVDGTEVIEEIDGLVYADGIYCLVEVKDHQKPIGFEPIAKMRSQLLRRPAGTIGIVFSKRGFTEAAQQLSCFLFPQTILLWGLDEVERCLEGRLHKGEKLGFTLGLRIKFEQAVKDGDPRYNLRELDEVPV